MSGGERRAGQAALAGSMHSLRVALAVARRELGAQLHSAVAHVVAVLFLAIQGLSFWAVVQVLSDPQRQAPYGAVLKAHFGGTVLSWAVLFAVVSALSMRLVAEERSRGTWEALMTAPVSEGAVVAGKWLGAWVFATLLWLPTVAYVGILGMYLPEGAALDLGPVAAAYAGVFAAQAGFLALGAAASAATSSQVVAAVTTFVGLLALLVLGQIPELAPAWIEARPAAATALGALDVRGHLEAFAAGAIPRTGLLLFAGLAASGLAIAAALAAAGRRRRREVMRRAVAAGLVVAVAGLSVALAARHPRTYDVTAAGAHSLHPQTRAALDRLDEPVTAIVVRPLAEVFDPVYEQVDGVLSRMQDAQPRLSRRDFDAARDPDRASALAEEFSIAPGDLAEGGAVIFDAGGRRRAVELLAMAEFDYDDLGVGAISELRAEEAFARAIVEVTVSDRPTICFTSQRGEMPIEAQARGADWAHVAERLERDAMAVRDIGAVSDEVPADCRVLVVAGPKTPLGARAAAAVQRYLDDGGRVLVAASRRLSRDGVDMPATGLELPLAERGLSMPRAIAVDPTRALDGPGLWSAVDRYGDHPVVAGFEGRQVTVWRWPRVVAVDPPEGMRAVALVTTSDEGWGATDVEGIAAGNPAPAAGDHAGPVAVAAAAEDPGTGARAVVLGSAEAVSSEVVGAGAIANSALATSAIAWLAGQTAELDIGPKTPERVRLIMTEADRQTVFLLSVVALPLGFAALGLGAFFWRRGPTRRTR